MNENPRSFPMVETFFVGGVGDEVTGSCTLLKVMTSDGKDQYLVIDAGAVQGTEEFRNYTFPVRAEDISAAFLTHGHYDHVGATALLYKNGFRGTIYASEITQRVLTPMLIDGAKVSAQQVIGATGRTNKLFRRMQRKLNREKLDAPTFRHVREFEDLLSQFAEAEFEPLYTKEDVEAVLELVKPVEVGRYIDVSDSIKVRFMPTTHQNGACRVEIHVTDPNGQTYGMAFSGDIGPSDSLLYKQKLPYTSKKIDCLMLEVLHGVKEPEETLKTSIKRLTEIIKKGIRQKKHIVLAGFSLDRNAMLVYLMNELRKQGVYVHVVIDSPLTVCQLGIYQSTYRTCGYWFKELGQDPFDDSDFEVIKNYRAHSFSVNHGEAPRVIITASATGSGGRIVDYFEAGIERPDYVFVFCGWSAPDSPSSILHDARYGQIVEMPERRYVKRCKTYRLHGFTSHGYFPEVVDAIADYPNCKSLILNHARNEDRNAVCDKINEFFEGDIVMPEYYDAYLLSKEGITPVEHEDALLDFERVIDRSIVRMEYEKLFADDDDDDDFVEGELFP